MFTLNLAQQLSRPKHRTFGYSQSAEIMPPSIKGRHQTRMGIQKPRAEHLQVAAALRNAIQEGEWDPGELMPSEPELAARYGVTRATRSEERRVGKHGR